MLQGPRFPLRGHQFLVQALGSAYGALLNCLIVGHGPRGDSKNVGLGRT